MREFAVDTIFVKIQYGRSAQQARRRFGLNAAPKRTTTTEAANSK